MAYQDQLFVKIDNKIHEHWTDANIARSIERGAHSFDLTLTDSFETASHSTPQVIQAGMSVQVFINNEQIIAGYIDTVKPSYDAKQHTLQVSGRSKIGDLIDCSMAGMQFPVGQNLNQIATTLCKLFDITVLVDDSVKVAANETFKTDHHLDVGQPVWEFLEELARIKAVLLISDSTGNLVLTRAGSAISNTALELGKNIKSASGSFSQIGLFSEYTVCGQQANNPQVKQDTKTSTQPVASVSSSTPMRYRPFMISSDNQADTAACKTRAEWQRNVNESRSQSMTYTVQGWRKEPNGELWAPNELVHIKDEWMGVDEQFLITETRMQLGSNGSTTEIFIMPKGAFDIVPENEQI